MSGRLGTVLAAIAAMMAFPAGAAAFHPVTGEVRANTNEAGVQASPDTAMDAAGNCVVTWEGPGDGASNGVWYRLYDFAGQPLTVSSRPTRRQPGLRARLPSRATRRATS